MVGAPSGNTSKGLLPSEDEPAKRLALLEFQGGFFLALLRAGEPAGDHKSKVLPFEERQASQTAEN